MLRLNPVCLLFIAIDYFYFAFRLPQAYYGLQLSNDKINILSLISDVKLLKIVDDTQNSVSLYRLDTVPFTVFGLFQIDKKRIFYLLLLPVL